MKIQNKINKLSEKKQTIFRQRYDSSKLNKGSAWALWFFGFHYLHTGRIGLWLLYIVSCFVYIGIAWWIIQGFMLNDNIDKKNEEIAEKLYNEIR